jgi:peroxiredoxin
MKLKVNEPAPDFTLLTEEGNPIKLSEVLNSGQHVLLVFLRHLG